MLENSFPKIFFVCLGPLGNFWGVVGGAGGGYEDPYTVGVGGVGGHPHYHELFHQNSKG